MKKRILVTGATGFIGQNLVDYLQSIGHYELIKTTRCITAEDSKLTLDLSDLSTIENTELSNIDIVIHLAGAAHNRVNNSEEVEIINTKSTAMLANKSVLNNVSRFIFVSTIGVHGSNTRMIVNENSAINCQTTYSISKYNAEIVYKGQQIQLMDFIMQIRTDVKNNGDAFLGSLKLTQNNVFYNSDNTKITKLKITQ